MGYLALNLNTTGARNNAFGGNALDANTTASENNAFGFGALGSNTTGSENVAIGQDCLTLNTTASGNTAVGAGSLKTNTTGATNTGCGKFSLRQLTEGTSNTAVGYQAGLIATTGDNNTAIGDSALQSLTTGDGNVAIGQASGGQGNMINITTESNRAVFGHDTITHSYVKVDWTVTSDQRDKMNFSEVPHGLSFVNDLQPVKFNFKKSRENATPHGKTKYGFKAQDILALEGNNPIVIDNENEDSLKITNSHLIPILVKALQELSTKLDTAVARIAELEG